MSLYVDNNGYLIKSDDPDWSSGGTIFLRMAPAFFPLGATQRMFCTKSTLPFVANFFAFGTSADGTQIKMGFYLGSDTRLSAPIASISQVVWACHLFSWDSATPSRQYYIDNVLLDSTAASFTVPTGNNILRFGNWDLGSGIVDPAHIYICEHARWNRTLTADERHTLQTTCCPLFVPKGLMEYHPFIRTSGAGRDLMGRCNLTVVSPFLAEAFMPMFTHPESGNVWAGPAAQPPLEIGTPLVSSPFQVFAPSLSFTGEQTLDVPLVASAMTVYAPTVSIQEATIQEDSRELEPHNLKVRIVDFVAGDDLRITRLYTGLAGGITISKGYLTIKRLAKDDTDAEAVVQKTITTAEQVSGQITDNDTTGGSIQLYFDLSNSETALLTPLIPYHYDVQVITIGNAVYTCEKGVIVMQQGVTETNS